MATPYVDGKGASMGTFNPLERAEALEKAELRNDQK